MRVPILLLGMYVRYYYEMHVRHRTPSGEITIRTLYTIGAYVYYTIIIYNNTMYLYV